MRRKKRFGTALRRLRVSPSASRLAAANVLPVPPEWNRRGGLYNIGALISASCAGLFLQRGRRARRNIGPNPERRPSDDAVGVAVRQTARGGEVEVIVNGEARQLPEGMTVAQLLEDMVLTAKRLAVEVNLAIVPRSTYDTYRLRAGDRVEIVHAIGGG